MSVLLSLPCIKNQTRFNLDRWDELGRDPEVRNWQGRIETDRYGRTIMYHYAEYSHGGKQSEIVDLLNKHAPAGGKATVETPISTSEGIRVADVAWASRKRLVKIGGRAALKGAPEICVEVLSPSNKRGEIEEKRRLYFGAGAQEVWVCDRRNRMVFFMKDAPDADAGSSKLCPKFPKRIDW